VFVALVALAWPISTSRSGKADLILVGGVDAIFHAYFRVWDALTVLRAIQ